MPTPNFRPKPISYPRPPGLPLETECSRKYDHQRALCEDPEKVSAWFTPVQKTINEYGILDNDIYNFDETGFQMCAANTSHQSLIRPNPTALPHGYQVNASSTKTYGLVATRHLDNCTTLCRTWSAMPAGPQTTMPIGPSSTSALVVSAL